MLFDHLEALVAQSHLEVRTRQLMHHGVVGSIAEVARTELILCSGVNLHLT